MKVKKYKLCEGKYEIHAADNGSSLVAYRNGELWQNMIGDNLTASLLNLVDSLAEKLQWYIDEDEVNEGEPENEYWLNGKEEAIALLENIK